MTMAGELVSKITASHLDRDWYVYVRQSTLTQVRGHTGSLEREYELALPGLESGMVTPASRRSRAKRATITAPGSVSWAGAGLPALRIHPINLTLSTLWPRARGTGGLHAPGPHFFARPSRA